MKIADIDKKVDLHLKDYANVRSDVDDIKSWLTWAIKIVLGAVILAVLAMIGLK